MSDEQRVVRGLTTTSPVDPEYDRLDHADIAAAVADIAMNEPTRANVALYGRWGSGKSSIGRAVAALLKDADVPFVRYDAFKWIEAPLHRHFLTQVAEVLKVPEMTRNLYRTESTNKLELTWDRTRESLKAWVIAVLVTVAVLALLYLGSNWVLGQLDDGTLRTLVAGVITPAAFLAAIWFVMRQLVPMALRSAEVTHRVDAPSSAEQFEETFRQIVKAARKKSKSNRIVVFIDELDRCAPDDVVATLNTIRTFVGIDGVVTIVAADREALEAALDRAIPQETPRDPDHPYYSSGGAVLDKTFTHSVDIPPPLPETMTRFARDTAEAEGGVWSDLADLPRVVSVLIPAHVTSPRRVKALLNAYVVAYTLMVQRMDDARSLIHGRPAGRELELAKLVCLTVEYPLFARQLAEDDGLTAKLLELGDERTTGRSRQIWLEKRALDILDGRLPVRTDISDQSSDGATDAQGDGTQLDGDEAVGAAAVNGAPTVDELIAYLQRTRNVPGPHTDLIHLRGMGTTFGLPAGIAHDARRLAEQDAAALRSYIAALPEEQQGLTIRSVASALPNTVGVETDNVVDNLLAVIAEWDDERVRPLADDLSNKLLHSLTTRELSTATRAVALRLVLLSDDGHRARHTAELLSDVDLHSTPELAPDLLRTASGIKDSELDKLLATAITASLLHPDYATIVATIVRESDRDDLLELARPAIEEELSLVPTGEEDESAPRETVVAALKEAVDALGPSEGSRTLILACLVVNHISVRNTVAELLPTHGPFASPESAARLMRLLPRRFDGGTWVEGVDWTSLPPEHAVELLEFACSELWRRAAEKGMTQDNTRWASALGRAAHAGAGTVSMAPDGFAKHLDSTEAVEWAPPLAALLASSGLDGIEKVAAALAPRVIAIFEEPPANAQPATVQAFQDSHRERITERLAAVTLAASEGHGPSVLEALRNNKHIPRSVSTAYDVAIRAAVGSDLADSVSSDDIAFALNDPLEDGVSLLSAWFVTPSRTADQVRAGLGKISRGPSTKPVTSLLREWSKVAPGSEVAQMAIAAARGEVAMWVLRALERDRVDPETFADGLGQVLAGETTIPDRERCLQAWDELHNQMRAVRKQLVTEVFFPIMRLAASGLKGDADTVRRYLRLLTSPQLPRDTKAEAQQLAEAIVKEHRNDRNLHNDLKAEGLITGGLLKAIGKALGGS